MKEFNLCPMCWMPLYAGSESNVDKAWAQVQTVFKGKPAFSIEKEGAKGERPVLVFGVSELMHPNKKQNCEDCHFVHESANKEGGRLGELWRTQKFAGGAVNVPILDRLNERLKMYKYTGGTAKFIMDKCVKKGIFGSGVLEFASADLFNDSLSDAMLKFSTSGFTSKIFGKFSGCRDCNAKMTVVKFIQKIIELLLNGSHDMDGALSDILVPGRKRARTEFISTNKETFPHELGMQCILLSGMMEERDTITESEDEHEIQLTITDASHCESWTFRFCALWCLLQVLFSMWENRAIGWAFRHHVSYVYSGIQNFYLALLFFLLHCANGRSALDFEEFNFFYASHLPFFIMKHDTSSKHRSLSAILTNEDIAFGQEVDPDYFSNNSSSRKLEKDFEELKTAVLDFWSKHFKPLSDFIHGREFEEKEKYSAFFCSRANAKRLSNGSKVLNRDIRPDLSAISHFFNTGPGYWFHFKSITMAKIEMDSELYYASHDDPLIRQMWADWYRHLCFRIRQLDTAGVRLAAVASHFQLGDGPSMHLSALLRGGAGSRWRTRVV